MAHVVFWVLPVGSYHTPFFYQLVLSLELCNHIKFGALKQGHAMSLQVE